MKNSLITWRYFLLPLVSNLKGLLSTHFNHKILTKKGNVQKLVYTDVNMATPHFSLPSLGKKAKSHYVSFGSGSPGRGCSEVTAQHLSWGTGQTERCHEQQLLTRAPSAADKLSYVFHALSRTLSDTFSASHSTTKSASPTSTLGKTSHIASGDRDRGATTRPTPPAAGAAPG